MSIDSKGPRKSVQKVDLQETVRAIDGAIKLSRAQNQRFLTYLLEMARLETTNLISAGNSTSPAYPAPDVPPKDSK